MSEQKRKILSALPSLKKTKIIKKAKIINIKTLFGREKLQTCFNSFVRLLLTLAS